MIYVDRNKIPVPEIFSSSKLTIAEQNLEAFYHGRKEQRSQKRFSRQFEPEIRSPILHALRLLFNDKCAYCESIIVTDKSSIYDHFRPKYGARGMEKEFADEHYWWLTYEWRNFYYCCRECNQYKATWFPIQDNKRTKPRTPYEKIIVEEKPLLLDPCNDNPAEHLTFKNNGEVDFLTSRGKTTIELLKLNRKPLINSRNKSLADLLTTWELFLKLWKRKDNNWAQIREIGKDWALILNERSYKAHIGATKQIILDKITRHGDIQEFFTKKNYNLTLETRHLSGASDSKAKAVDIDFPKTREILNKASRKKIEASAPKFLTKQIYIESLELRNYKCFDNMKLNFRERAFELNSNNNTQPWHLFLGENGVGKSSILRAISIALMGNSYRLRMKEYITPKQLLKNGKKAGYIRLTYNEGEQILVKFSDKNNEIIMSTNQALTNLIGYGAIRLLPKGPIQPEKGNFDGVKVGNLFDYTVALGDANKWLFKISQKDFDKAAIALKDLMLLEEDSILVKDEKKQQIFVKTDSGKSISVEDLSDGYKTVFALTVDIMSTLSSENVSYDLAEGIVLIDEIGTHLHPRWKMQVVERLRNAFPKLQFIVSTHEPLCLRGLKSGETIVLSMDELKQVIAITDLPDPSDLRIDQILTSDFFGLKSTLDPKTERLFDEYYGILAKEEIDRTDQEKQRVFELSEIIPRIKHLGDDLREDLVYYVIDQLLAKKVKTDGLKIKENLREEALKKVENIWNSIKHDSL